MKNRMNEWHIWNHDGVLLKVQVEAGGDGVHANGFDRNRNSNKLFTFQRGRHYNNVTCTINC